MSEHTTIAEARQVVEDMRTTLHPEVANDCLKVIAAAETEAKVRADNFIERNFGETLEVGSSAADYHCELRSDARSLAAEIASGALTASEAADRLSDIRGRRRRNLASVSSIEAKAALIERIEEDPIGWHDSVRRKTPALPPWITLPI